jgi:hypothetical protein
MTSQQSGRSDGIFGAQTETFSPSVRQTGKVFI